VTVAGGSALLVIAGAARPPRRRRRSSGAFVCEPRDLIESPETALLDL
jgi:hypothetical protein